MAHTPGPWRRHTAYPDRIIVNGSCVYQVHDITTPDGFAANGYGQPNPDDTQLMAAAPELLAACKELFMQMRREGCGHQQILERALAAIAKAEGRGE